MIIGLLMMIKEKNSKKKKKKSSIKKNHKVGEMLTVDKDQENKKGGLFKLRKSKTLNFVDGKSNAAQGIINGQMKKEKKKDTSLKKPIGWVQAESYDDDVRTSNVNKYVHEEPNDKKTNVEEPTGTNKNKPHVLVVDDSVTVLKFISKLLIKEYEIVTKEDGSDGLTYLNMVSRLPDLIITDLEMPKMTGAELIQAIRKDSRFKNIPILIVSSNPAPHLYLLEDGLVNGVIQKPFDKEDFMTQVKYLINN